MFSVCEVFETPSLYLFWLEPEEGSFLRSRGGGKDGEFTLYHLTSLLREGGDPFQGGGVPSSQGGLVAVGLVELCSKQFCM